MSNLSGYQNGFVLTTPDAFYILMDYSGRLAVEYHLYINISEHQALAKIYHFNEFWKKFKKTGLNKSDLKISY